MGVRSAKPKAQLIVRSLSRRSQTGTLSIGALQVPCALGRSGKVFRKKEGDGATPIGLFPLRFAFYRQDRIVRPATGLPLRRLAPHDGWCDAPGDLCYNRFVRHPFRASAEQLWRADHLYDVIVVIGHNDQPRRRAAGSAIFLHMARDGLKPTEGCIAVRAPDMRKVLLRIQPSTRIRICN
jgi:L,D-peptidoglycan transpeptidase YkuD (ErfK/YbiS/YcfS/YnhG family)